MDTFMNMDAYVQDNQTEEAYMQMAATYLDSSRIGVGVCECTQAIYLPSVCTAVTAACTAAHGPRG